MKILQVNKFNYPRGGADKYFLDLTEALKATGHEVAVFSMQHPNNLKSDWEKYFVSRLSFNENLNIFNRLRMIMRVIYSFEAKRKFKALINDFQPDIVHLHNIYHHISPSILDVCRQKKIKVVMHLHDYKLVCPNHTMFVKGKHCQKCRGHRYFNCVKNRCLKDSFFASALVALEMFIHHRVLKIYEKNISLFISPSKYLRDVCLDFSWPESKFRVIYNSYSNKLKENTDLDNLSITEDYLLYFGRLGAEKGISTLIKALKNNHENLKIVGEGEELEKLKLAAKDLGRRVEFLGYKEGKELGALIKSAKAIVMPSIWPENMPLSLLEAMSLSKVVIASAVGGFPEIITDTKSGFLFQAGSSDALNEKIELLKSSDLVAIGREASLRVANLSPENNLEGVIKVYRELITSD